MRLTNYSDFALRSLMYLAVKPNAYELANIQDIADAYAISKSHLTKVIHQLSSLGYIDSVRGKHGGIRLAKAPKEINIGELIRHTEPDFAIVDCFNEDTSSQPKNSSHASIAATTASVSAHPHIPLSSATISCVISPVCQLKPVLHEATQAFLTVLDRYTLADVIQNADELLAVLDSGRS